MNFCKDCRKAFEITVDVDYCDTCRIINNIRAGESSDIPLDYEEKPEIVREIMRRYMAYGYE